MHQTIALSVFVAATSLAACGTNVPTAPYPAEPPQVYVAKVKNILVGLPPTDAEVAQVIADPSSFSDLVTGWMATPQYSAKMQVFFELAFQQTQITESDYTDLIPPNGIGTGKPIPLLVQNSTESFARTVIELNAQGRPLTDAFTTHQLMMTTAMMEFYGFLDARSVDDNEVITDSFQVANPKLKITMQTAAGQVPIADTLNPASPSYMTWYVPDLPNLTNFPNDATCDAVDPIVMTASAMNLHELLYGEIPTHFNAAGTKQDCAPRNSTVAYGQMQASDFTDWRMVTISQGAATTRFFDLPTLRSSSTLTLQIPRVGFFTTPAYFANWPTNTSNMMRVTTNQALIVATGHQVDGTDSTVPPSTPGLDSTHAVPGSACYGCHQLLDPTRSVFQSQLSYYYYPQTEASGLTTQPGLFAFQGVIAYPHTLDDFGQTLASHPLVAAAWAQKLCYYVNSAPCDPTDPAFTTIVSAFSNGFSWNNLVHDLVISPITTNAAESQTVDLNGEVIAVTRLGHMCAALNNRLGFTDICGLDLTLASNKLTQPEATIQEIAGGLPSDGYGRGATIPVLPNQPSLFYRAGMENICEAVAELTIDSPPIANQPNAIRWSSTQPQVAISAFVSTIMGLTSSDPRAAQATAVLQSHYTQAQQTGVNATSALQSTFVAACLSPTFIGIGM